MRTRLLNIWVLVFLSLSVAAQPAYNSFSAYSLPKRATQIGFFSPLRLATGYKTEVFTHFFANYKVPNLGIKRHWVELPWEIQLATAHQLFYPTPFLNNPVFIQHAGSDMQAPRVPGVFAFNNELILSTFLKKKSICSAQNYLLNLSLGFSKSLQFKPDSLYPVYGSHLAYIRNTGVKKPILWHTKLHFEMEMSESLDFFAAVSYMRSGYHNGSFAIEHQAGLRHNFNEKLLLSLGYKMSTGNYPKTEMLYFTPYADLLFRFRTKKIFREKNLFEHKMF